MRWQNEPHPITKGEKMSEWQPIETAPKDGTDILLGYYPTWPGLDLGKGSCEVAFWHGIKNTWCGRVLLNADGHFSPTHWMPLPPPPKDE